MNTAEPDLLEEMKQCSLGDFQSDLKCLLLGARLQ